MIALWRPIEINSTNCKMDVVQGASTYNVVLDKGSYPSIWYVLYRIRTKLQIGLAVTTDIQLTSDNYVKITFTTSTSISFPSDSTLWSILGFEGDQSAAVSHTATYTPKYCFFPTYQPYDGSRFVADQKKSFYGNTGSDGSINGIVSGFKSKIRTIRLSSETASKVFIEDTVHSTTQNSYTEDWEKERCFETFAIECRTAALEGLVGDHDNCSVKGFYYINDISEWQGVSVGSDIDDAGGTLFNRASSPDKYVFCNLPVVGIPNPKATSQQSTAYYDIELTASTSSISTNGWSAS